MTSKIEVPRELLERAESILGSQGFSAWSEISDQLRALLTTPEAPRQSEPVPLEIPDECPHLIVFDDADREQLMFAGTGARKSALKAWAQISTSWNAHLFVRIDRNSRDCRFPSATAAPLSPDHSGGASQDVIKFGIEVEKLLCATLGREWSATGISIQSLIEELKSLTTSDHSGGGAGVVVPERLRSNWAGEKYNAGWNDCLDKVKELNQ